MHFNVFKTLADPMRLRIVETLREGEHAVNDLVDKVEIHQSGVSRHLRILHEAGFVRVRPEGQKRLYSLCPEPFRELDAWVANYRRFWEARLDKFSEALRRKQKASPTKRQETNGSSVHMVLTFDAMHDEEWTKRAVMGQESQLGKLEKVIAGK